MSVLTGNPGHNMYLGNVGCYVFLQAMTCQAAGESNLVAERRVLH